MPSSTAEPTDASAAFSVLRSSASSGIPVVPLIGAGVSVAAGVPSVAQITEHLVRIYYLLKEREVGDATQYLLDRGWPGRHSLNAELHAISKNGSIEKAIERAQREFVTNAVEKNLELRRGLLTSSRTLLLRAMLADQVPGEPTPFVTAPDDWNIEDERRLTETSGTEWLLLLLHLAGRNQGLIDSYFARLIRRRTYTTSHQFIAFLTKVFNWNPILTTNFDDLLESALRTQGINPIVFELARDLRDPDHSLMPDPRLVQVAGQTSIIKLHGGTHGLRAGYDLNEPLSKRVVDTYCEYLPERATLLVLGYGAQERRITSLLEAWQSNSRGGGQIVWVYRTQNPKNGDVSETLTKATHFVRAEDPGLFLHELYQRMLFTHPASLQTYTALHYAPSTTYDRLYRRASVQRIGFVPPQNSARRALRSWYDDVRGGKKNAIRLWFSVHEFPCLAAFLATLIEALEAADRGLPVAARPCTFDTADDFTGARYREHISNALTRHPYRIAIDSYRAFRNGRASTEEQLRRNSRDEDEQLRLYAFLSELVELGIGESSLAVSLHPGDDGHLAASGERLRVFPSDPAPSAPGEYEINLSDACRELAGDDSVARTLLEVAVAFRRPRGLTALAKITASLLEGTPDESEGADTTRDVKDPVDPFVGAYYGRYSEIVRQIDRFESLGLLEHHDGGFYSLCSEAHVALAEHFATDKERTLRLQSRIADYYCAELYEHSKDPRAFFEYAFHRVAAANQARECGKESLRWEHLAWLVATIEREADALFARGQAARLLFLLSRVIEQSGAPRPLMSRLLRVKANIHRRATDYDACKKIHLDLLRGLLGEGSGSETVVLQAARNVSERGPSERLEIAGHCLEIGGCLNARGWPFRMAGTGMASDWLNAGRILAESVLDGSGSENEDLRQQASALVVRCLKSLIKLGTRTSAPWEWMGGVTEPPTVLDERSHYDDAIARLRSMGPRLRQRGMQCSVRCSYARSLYLRGEFGHASVELNRAHAFGARATGGEGWEALTEYHLHRAEYCLYRALRLKDSEPTPTWLLQAAATALREAEDNLRRGDRSAASWLWFYLQSAWLNRDRLRVSDGRSCSESEEYLLAGLQAVEGALLNVNANTTAEAAALGLWSDLREQCFEKLAPDYQQRKWEELNRRAGLGPMRQSQMLRRQAPDGILLRVEGQDLPVKNLNQFGVGLSERIGTPPEVKDGLLLVNGTKVRALVRCCHEKGAALASMECESRLVLRSVLDGAAIIERPPPSPNGPAD